MNRFERWFLKLVFAKEVRQGPDHPKKVTGLFRMVCDAAEKEFTEDNKPTLCDFLRERFEQSLAGETWYELPEIKVASGRTPKVREDRIDLTKFSHISVSGPLADLMLALFHESWRLQLLEDDHRDLLKALESGEASDGYHTINELYEYRRAYNTLLFNAWAAAGVHDVHKSWKHSDGEPCFGKPGKWFIVVAQTSAGQVSNHYKAEHWDSFKVPDRERSAEYDGHTPQIALARLLKTLSV